MSENETIADIANEIREYFDLLKRGLIPEIVDRMTTRQRHQYWADRIEAAAEREREETKDYFAKLHDGPSMICTAKNCSLRNAAEDIVGQVKAEASFGHFTPVVVEDRQVGNAAALREALERIVNLAPEYPADGVDWNALAAEAFLAASSALAAAPRNCDRFRSAEEAYSAWLKHNSLTAICDWLFAPAEGKEADHA